MRRLVHFGMGVGVFSILLQLLGDGGFCGRKRVDFAGDS